MLRAAAGARLTFPDTHSTEGKQRVLEHSFSLLKVSSAGE
jgi:hypothetical protein